MSQTFGFNLRYYTAHYAPDYRVQTNFADGPYLFKPNLTHQFSDIYSKLDPDISFEQGNFVDQWTIDFLDPKTQQAALVKVRFSERFDDFIEFEVEMSEIPVNDNVGKDVTVNWKFYDGF